MFRFSLQFAAILVLAPSAFVFAQGRAPVPIKPLLNNSDPRLVALGAWETVTRGDESDFAIMVRLVEQWDPEQRHLIDDADRYDAMTVILDALIQRKVTVTPAGVAGIAYAFPDQAAILITRLPFSDAEPILMSWFESGEGANRTRSDSEAANRRMLARIAAMMLANQYPQSIAARLLSDSIEWFAISVPDAGAEGVEKCLTACDAKPACAAEFADPQRVAWPYIFQYTLEENNPEAQRSRFAASHLVVEAGGDRITYRRARAEIHLNSCYSPAPLSPQSRHRLLAGMLGIADEQMPWSVQMDLTLPWVSNARFERELADQVSKEEARLREFVKEFQAKGLITKGQMETTRSKLAVVVFDDRGPAVRPRPALPELKIRDSRTSYRISSSSIDAR
jgi:hypothetical protein